MLMRKLPGILKIRFQDNNLGPPKVFPVALSEKITHLLYGNLRRFDVEFRK